MTSLCECDVPGDCPDDSTPGCKLAEGKKFSPWDEVDAVLTNAGALDQARAVRRLLEAAVAVVTDAGRYAPDGIPVSQSARRLFDVLASGE